MDNQKQRASIDMWRLSYEYDVPQLVGSVSGHPRLEDGLTVRTSKVLRIDFEDGVAETLNTIYSLGRPSIIIAMVTPSTSKP